ncbi:SMC-Scp complex subunit ScpB [Aestuariicella sp. G3-2]|uniref:SMC-Scp complex subunit ScpB n=1 Tax=Pseudomaricurvus albidus TaxID=2842452 RepID=UPI001C0E8B49|nr:SMC-Scp complex subunit ScpB [Aestuariicella albida]MBU3069874.1 SMC-Scp complex subunit ScpB [Aestuariicella albida]
MSFDKQLLRQIIEGALLAAGQPLTREKLLSLFDTVDEEAETATEAPSKDDIQAALEEIQAECGGRGFELVEVGSGWRFQVRKETAPWVNRLWDEKPQKYSRALLETLALIAYRQPITRGDIEEIRGVAVSSHIIKTLTEREWIKVVGHRDVPGRPSLYATTKGFLDYFSLRSLEELPSLGEIQDIESLNNELDLQLENAVAEAQGEAGAAEGDSQAQSEPSEAQDAEISEQADESVAASDDASDEVSEDGSENVAEDSTQQASEIIAEDDGLVAEEPAYEEDGLDDAELAEPHVGENAPLSDDEDERTPYEKLMDGDVPTVEPEASDDDDVQASADIQRDVSSNRDDVANDSTVEEPPKEGRDSLFAPSTAASVFDETD